MLQVTWVKKYIENFNGIGEIEQTETNIELIPKKRLEPGETLLFRYNLKNKNWENVVRSVISVQLHIDVKHDNKKIKKELG